MTRSSVATPVGPELLDLDEPHDDPSLGLAGSPDTVKSSAAWDAVVFTGATYVAQSVLFGARLVQKGVLGPVATGYWALMQAFLGCLTAATLGTSDGTTRQIPLRRGRRDFAGAAAISDTGNSFSLAAVGVAGLTLLRWHSRSAADGHRRSGTGSSCSG